MSSFVEPSRSRAASRLALLAGLAAGLAGCSSDRFMETPFASRPQASPEVTGSVQPAPAPTHKVETSALAPPTYGGSAGIGGIGTPARQEVTGSVSTHQKQSAPAWRWDGGTA